MSAIEDGLVVGVPTDTVYGVAADPFNEGAMDSLFALKGRSRSEPIPILGASVAQLLEVVELPPAAEALALRHWPGPLTLVVWRRSDIPGWIGSDLASVAVRVPDHPVALELLEATGPLAMTSANRSGEPAAINNVQALELLGDGVALYLEGSCPGELASTVIDVTGGESVVLRDGPING